MCCLSIIQYRMCQHFRLYKVGCAAGREEGLCPTPQQELLVLTTYRWTCEDCYMQRFRTEADARMDMWSERARLIESDENLTRDTREMRVWALRDREDHEEELLEERRLAQVQEMQYAEYWTSQYGHTVYLLQYRRGRLQSQRPEQPDADMMEEDQQPEQPQLENGLNRVNGVGEQQQDEQDQDEQDRLTGDREEQPRLENGVNGVGEQQQDEQDRLPDDREEQPQLENGENGENGVNGVNGGVNGMGERQRNEWELAEVEHRIHRLRILQPHDLAVLRDALRTSKELRRQREEQRERIQRDYDKMNG